MLGEPSAGIGGVERQKPEVFCEFFFSPVEPLLGKTRAECQKLLRFRCARICPENCLTTCFVTYGLCSSAQKSRKSAKIEGVLRFLHGRWIWEALIRLDVDILAS